MRPQRNLVVFEFDRRFDAFGDEFVFYDYNEPLNFNPDLVAKFDFLIVDPPFLSNECWTKTSQSVMSLAKPNSKILVCTGLIMQPFIEAELNCFLTKFKPKHSNGLSNEFGCFANYNCTLSE